MARVDNKKTGDAAVGVVKSAFQNAKNILPFLETNDNGICTDGYLEVYSSSEELTKETLRGTISVQVKGTTSKPDSGRPKRRVDIADLERFRDVFHGALYFVVYFDGNLDTRGIYYKQYLPYDVEKTLTRKGRPDQKTITERFSPLPTGPKELDRLCREFLQNMEKQASVITVGVKTPEEWGKQGLRFEKLNATKTLVADEMPFSLKAFKNGAYLYGVSEWGESYVFDKLEYISRISGARQMHIDIGDFSCDPIVEIGEDEDEGQFVTIGGITLYLGEGTKGRIVYTSTGDFRARFRDAQIMKGFVGGNVLMIEGLPQCRDAMLNEGFSETLSVHLEDFGKYSNLLDELRIKPSWDPKDLTDSDLWQLDRLHAAIIEHEPIRLPQTGESTGILDVNIANAVVKTIVRRRGDGLYDVFDPFSESMACSFAVTNDKDERIVDIHPLFVFSSEDFRRMANIDSERFAQILETRPVTCKSAGLANNKLLEMLSAYDAGAVCAGELLPCCLVLSEALHSLSNDSISAINLAQVKLRLGKAFDRSQIEKISLTTNDMREKCAAHIVLGNISLAESCFGMLSKDEREDFESWPISNLLGQDNK